MNPQEIQELGSSSQQQQRQRQLQHSKESEEVDVSFNIGQAPVAVVEETTTTTTTTSTTTTTTSATTTTTTIHEEEAHQAAPSHDKDAEEKTQSQLQNEYEALFPPAPVTKRAATTFTLFSDPDSFSPEAIASRTHYLTDSLEGTLWLDADGDGKRGSGLDSTLNALEYDTGIGGVTVSLVKCETNELVSEGLSLPNNGVGEGSTTKITMYAEAGHYSFPLDLVESGRYYIMYRAPQNFRISGNILPLQEKSTEDGAYFECIPGGGEGIDYLEQVQTSGDLNLGGYCARSIGCMEIDKKFNLEDKFSNLQILEGGNEQDWVGTTMNLVALPSTNMGNVGLAEEEWPLSTYQFADAQITLSFPSSVSESDLSSAVPQDFGKSAVKQNLDATLAKMLVEERGDSPFVVAGVDVVMGDISVPQDAAARGLRGLLRSLQGENAAPPQETTVTYTLTARGSYRPPPFNELGTNVQDSINANPQGLVKSLKDKEGALPPLFNNVEGAAARHLTLKISKDKPQPIQTVRVVEAPSPRMATWAISPVIVLSMGIAGLMGIFIFRRVFIRRKKPVTYDQKIQQMTRDLFGQSNRFVVSPHPEDEVKQKMGGGEADSPGVMLAGDFDDGIRVRAASTESSNEDSEDRECHERRERRRRERRENNNSGTQTASHTSGGTTGTARSGASHSNGTNGSRRSRGSRSHGSGSDNPYVVPLETSEQQGGHRRNKKKKKKGDHQVAHSMVEQPSKRSEGKVKRIKSLPPSPP